MAYEESNGSKSTRASRISTSKTAVSLVVETEKGRRQSEGSDSVINDFNSAYEIRHSNSQEELVNRYVEDISNVYGSSY